MRKKNWLVAVLFTWFIMGLGLSTATAGMSHHKNIVNVVTYQTVGDWFSPYHYGAPKFQSLYNHTYFRFADEDWGWQHQWDVPDNCHLSSANLFIHAFDVDYPAELDLLYGDEQYVGTLTGKNNKWRWCKFDLMPIRDQLSDGELNLWLDIDHDAIGAAVGMWKSRLVLKYGCDYKGQEPIHTPVPGAALLGFMGVGLVGWLRRTRSSLFG